MKRTIILVLLITLLTACSAAPTSTAIPTTAPTTAPTAQPTPTAVQPSMENLPSEWQGKIDHVETLADGRTVAVAKLTDEQAAAGLKPQLRELQWDKARGEWISYVPQVGLINESAEYWDLAAKSDEMSGVELQAITAEPIYGKDGQEIKPGLVADFSDATLFCGDLIEVNTLQGGTEFIFKVTLATGDIELFQVGTLAGEAKMPNAVYDQATLTRHNLWILAGTPGHRWGLF